MEPALRHEIKTYIDIFNDYIDFKILPWHKVGVDRGKYLPVRKNALRLLKIEESNQKWEAHEIANGRDPTNPNSKEQTQSQREAELGFAVRKSTRVEKDKQASSRGVKYTEVITNTAQFPVPDYDDVLNWDENTWKKYASPLELDDYYNEHPDEKPSDWISPRDDLKTREQDDKELAEEQQKKLEEMGWSPS